MKKTILRWALRLGPREWRTEFGPEIEADFEEGIRDARGRGRLPAFRFAIRTGWDLGRSGLGERWERRRSFSPSSARRKRKETVMQSTIGQDAKVAWRGLCRSPTFTAVAVYAGVVALLSAVVLLATLAPASKASRIAPVEALRYE